MPPAGRGPGGAESLHQRVVGRQRRDGSARRTTRREAGEVALDQASRRLRNFRYNISPRAARFGNPWVIPPPFCAGRSLPRGARSAERATEVRRLYTGGDRPSEERSHSSVCDRRHLPHRTRRQHIGTGWPLISGRHSLVCVLPLPLSCKAMERWKSEAVLYTAAKCAFVHQVAAGRPCPPAEILVTPRGDAQQRCGEPHTLALQCADTLTDYGTISPELRVLVGGWEASRRAARAACLPPPVAEEVARILVRLPAPFPGPGHLAAKPVGSRTLWEVVSEQ